MNTIPEQVKNINTIPDSGKWNEICAILNDNFSLIGVQLLQMHEDTVYNKGIHENVKTLNNAYPNPVVGSFAYVGTTTPFDIYIYQSNGWKDSGADGEPSEVDFTKINIANENSSGLMSQVHVQTLSSIADTVSTQSNTLSGLSSAMTTLTQSVDAYRGVAEKNKTDIEELNGVFSDLQSQVSGLDETAEELGAQISSIQQTANDASELATSIDEYITDKVKPIGGILSSFVNLGVFPTSGEAEQLAATYANNRGVFLMAYQTQGGASGIIYQYFSNTSATIQFLYLQGQRYVREVSWGNGTVGAWKNITGPERIKTLSFNGESNILSFEDALSGKTWGGVYLPFKETAAQAVAEVVANAPDDLNTLKEIAEYIASDKTNAADVATAIAGLQGGYGNLKDAIGEVQTALEEEVASSEQMYESLLSSITTAKNDMRSSTPIFDKVVTGEVTLAMGSATTNYQVVYLEDKKMFAALNAGKYWANWLAWGKYPSAVSYGPAPAVGKVYIMGNALYVWNGSSLNEIGDFDDIKKSIAHNTGAIANNVQAIDLLAEEVETKAPKEGYAPDLKVDFAKELVGRGVAEPQEIGVIRPTGEISIGDGNATIEKVKGKSVVWNQLYKAGYYSTSNDTFTQFSEKTINGVTFSLQNDGAIKVNGTASANAFLILTMGKQRAGRKFLLKGCPQGGSASTYGIADGALWLGYADVGNGSIISTNTTGYQFSIFVKTGVTVDNIIFRPQFSDLTQMFLAGNEPTTIEEFEARKPLGVTDECNEGEIISYDGTNELKSVGFNAWDEEWIEGSFFEGKFYPNQEGSWMTANKVYVINNQTYEITTPYKLYVNKFDAQGNYLGTDAFTNGSLRVFPKDVAYIIFRPYDSYATYTGGICIHLVHTGYRNGEYQPYEEDTLRLPNIKAIKDKDGNQLFPYGLLSAGSVYDEITATKAVKRIGVVDMGTLTWYTQVTVNGNTRFLADLSDIKRPLQSSVMGNVLTPKYQTYSADKVYLENVGISVDVAQFKALSIYDPNYTEKDSFKQAMQGVILYYELAEPTEVDLAEPLNLTYDAWDFGTEELIADGKTTPLNADIVYQFNAVDRIRENSKHANEANEILKNKQDTLVSGTNIKTINGESLLGEGDIAIGNSEYTLVLNKTFTEDVASYDVSVDVPNITSYKDFIILIEFKYQEGVSRGGWSFLLLNGDTYPKVSITANNIAKESYRTHYILRLHVGDFADMTAYLESHNNAFTQPQVNDGNVGMNWMCNYFEKTNYGKIKSFVFGEGFITGEKLKIYAR